MSSSCDNHDKSVRRRKEGADRGIFLQGREERVGPMQLVHTVNANYFPSFLTLH